MVKAQMKIQQTAFMILAVFLFFAMVFIFFLTSQSSRISYDYEQLTKDEAISAISTIVNLPELNCDSQKEFCVDLDKVDVLSAYSDAYKGFLPISTLSIEKIYPLNPRVKCPAENCTYYELFDFRDNNQTKKEYSTYVSLCRKEKVNYRVYDYCDIGKVIVGVKA